MSTIPFGRMDNSLHCLFEKELFGQASALEEEAVFCWEYLGDIFRGCIGKIQCSTQWEADCSLEDLVPKKLQFVQQGQFKAEFKCFLNGDNLNKAAMKPHISEQKSKVSRWRPLCFQCFAVKLVGCLGRIFYQILRDWTIHNMLNWNGQGDLLPLHPLN